eukprot:343208_1
MNNFGEQRYESDFVQFRSTILRNCLSQYQCIKLLFSNIEWFTRIMIEINVVIATEVTSHHEQSSPDIKTIFRGCVANKTTIEYVLTIEMFSRCVGFLKEYPHWLYLLQMNMHFADIGNASPMALLQRTLLIEAKHYNNLSDKMCIENEKLHILCMMYRKMCTNQSMWRKLQKDRRQQQFLNQLRMIRNGKNRKSTLKRNEICDILLLLFSDNAKGKD